MDLGKWTWENGLGEVGLEKCAWIGGFGWASLHFEEVPEDGYEVCDDTVGIKPF